jgi:nitroimidazol reductase NimA-like FMN-containing flavoprotein (pyridoxamine 5'-phosphate oxidase superfamily)
MKKAIPHNVQKGRISVIKRLKKLNSQEPHAVLATELKGNPYTSLVAYALTPDGKGIIFATPRKTRKYKNILKNKNVSLLLDNRTNTTRDYLGAEAVTILGKARAVRRGKEYATLAGILANKHPGLQDFIHSPSTALILIEIHQCIHVSRFQTVSEQVVT